MRELRFNQNRCRMLRFCSIILILSVSFAMQLADAGDKPGTPDAKRDEKIHITADRLVSDNNTGYAEFIGNVKATQDETVITADKLKIYYKKNQADKKLPSIGQESIHKITADGNVKIKFDSRVAETRQAVYNIETGVLILSGYGSKIISGNDIISGEKITFYRTEGRIMVESGSKERVEAFFHAGQKGLK